MGYLLNKIETSDIKSELDYLIEDPLVEDWVPLLNEMMKTLVGAKWDSRQAVYDAFKKMIYNTSHRHMPSDADKEIFLCEIKRVFEKCDSDYIWLDRFLSEKPTTPLPAPSMTPPLTLNY